MPKLRVTRSTMQIRKKKETKFFSEVQEGRKMEGRGKIRLVTPWQTKGGRPPAPRRSSQEGDQKGEAQIGEERKTERLRPIVGPSKGKREAATRRKGVSTRLSETEAPQKIPS